jgi:hypothetical protein
VIWRVFDFRTVNCTIKVRGCYAANYRCGTQWEGGRGNVYFIVVYVIRCFRGMLQQGLPTPLMAKGLGGFGNRATGRFVAARVAHAVDGKRYRRFRK